MALNIKNRRTQRLARDLARLTGQNMTAAVTEALQERIERVQGAQGNGLAARLVKIGKECAAHLREPYRTADHAPLLYDEKGLPR
jgi:antitoxin VapB